MRTPDEPHISVLDAEDLWAKEELVNIWLDGEELTVNKAMIDEGAIVDENLWDVLEMELLRDTLEKTRWTKANARLIRISQTCGMTSWSFGENTSPRWLAMSRGVAGFINPLPFKPVARHKHLHLKITPPNQHLKRASPLMRLHATHP